MQTDPDCKLDLSNESDAKERILIVEDDFITNEVIQFYLKGKFIIDIATSEEQAFEYLHKHKYFAALLDINLGRGGNGLNVVKVIRKTPGLEKLPVIAETAFALQGDAEEFLSAGCSYYLAKPFVKQELLSVLEKIRQDSDVKV